MVASASEANAVTPTTVPIAAFSSTALAAASLSTGVDTSNSSTSLSAMVKLWLWVEPSAEVASTVIDRLAQRLAVERRRGGHHAGRPIDREQPAGIVVQACR